jgi:hypothetical protein
MNDVPEIAELRKVLEDFTRNPYCKVIEEAVFHLEHNGNDVVTIYPRDKRAYFEEDHRDTRTVEEELPELVEFLEDNDYETNLGT